MRPVVAKLGLGAARFGPAPAGSTDRRRLSGAEAFATVALAASAGVRSVETSPRYGGSETVLGQVAPKDPPMEMIVRAAPSSDGVDAILRQARRSLRRLKIDRGAAILVDASAVLDVAEGARLWAGLERLKAAGLYDAIGLCACVCHDPVALAHRFQPDLMQLPLSLLDQRLLTSGVLAEVRALGVHVHARSAFASGALFAGEGLDAPLIPQVSHLRRLLAEAGADLMRAALGFVLARPEISKVIVGVASPAEMRAVLAAAAAPAPAMDWAALAAPAATARSCCLAA